MPERGRGTARPWSRAERLSDLGQSAIVAVLAVTIAISLVGAVLIRTVLQSDPLQQTKAVEVYANRALEAGANAYLAAVNANPSLAQCSTATNSTGTCGGINYGEWNTVNGSGTSGADPEYYAFGNPQPTFDLNAQGNVDSTHTGTLKSLSVQVLGAAGDPSAPNHYLFDQETITVAPSNGFLTNVWWSNYESYSGTGSYTNCAYNWNAGYNISGAGLGCGPVYFGPSDYLFGPVYSNDSLFISGDGTPTNSPSFGTSASPSTVSTADPNCLFVNSTYGMNGSDANCSTVSGDVAVYGPSSAYGHAVEQPPSSDAQLGVIAGQNGCLYSGPTQITLSTTAGGAGQMTVVSPDTVESTVTVNGTNYTWDNNNIASNVNQCPNNGTAPIPPNGVVFVQGATTAQTQAWANPFDDPIDNTVTNVTTNPTSPTANQSVTLTAKVTSVSNQINSGTTVAFSHATCSATSGSTCKSWNASTTINGCTAQTLGAPSANGTNPQTYTSTATCTTNESGKVGDTFSAVYSGGTYTLTSSANAGQTNTLVPAKSFGPDSQVTAGGCSNCYYGQTSAPDAEGDAFVANAATNGGLSGQLTIGTTNNVIVDGTLTYADCANTWTTGQSGLSAASEGFCPYNQGGTNDALGLIADNYVEVNRPLLASSTGNGQTRTVLPSCAGTPGATCDPSNGSNLTVDAAVLALTQSFVVNNYGDGNPEGQLIMYGSIQQYARGPIGTFNNGAISTGYQKFYTWDPLLDFVSPPSYLVPSTPSWTLSNTNTNAGNSGTSVCPPILPVYGSTQYVTQYCSTGTGSLPNYPSSTAPSPPTIGTATANADGSVTVNWTAPASSGGQSITGYSVSPTPQCTSCTGTTAGSGVTSTTIHGLTNGSYYRFSVVANNSLGVSSPSGLSNSVYVPTVPTAPTGVTATANANGTVTVNWTDPGNGGSPITSYSVTPSTPCAGCTYTNLTGSSISSTTITGLANIPYTFTVKATNGVGTGPTSAASNSVTPPTVPGTPTIGTATRGNASAVVTWTAPTSSGGPPAVITGYSVTPFIGGVAQTAQTFVSTATTETVTGLTNGTAYTFEVAAINAVGMGLLSGASNAVTPATVPGAPTIGSATAGIGTATVNFTAPGSNGGSAITGYTVTATDVTNSSRGNQTASGTVSPLTVTGLTSGDTYTFTVVATNALGNSSASSASNQVVIPTVPSAPAKPTTSVSGTSVTVNWVAPANGGSAITGYTITPSTGSPVTVGNVLTYTFTGLSTSTFYTFTVKAINGVGTGPASPASTAVKG